MKNIFKMKWWKRIMVYETIIVFVITVFAHMRGACAEIGIIGQVPEGHYGCVNYISYFKYFGYKYVNLFLSLIFILAVVLTLTRIIGIFTDKIFAKKNLYSKILAIEMNGFMFMIFAMIILLIISYDGQVCFGDDCSKTTLLKETPFIIFYIIDLFSNPITWGIIAAPYLAMFIYRQADKKIN